MTTSRRRSVDTRAALLQAARVAFANHGYDQAGVREITGTVGVNASLVNRYFGSKERLFAEAMQVGLGFDDFSRDWSDGIPAALADIALDREIDRRDFDPILSILRSAPILKAQPALRELLSRGAITPLAARLGGAGAEERASLIVAFVLGIVIMRTVVKCDPLASTMRNDLAGLIEQIIEATAHPDRMPKRQTQLHPAA